MSNIKSRETLETENNDLQKQLISARKVNRELSALAESQRRLVNILKKEVDDLNLLLCVKIEEINKRKDDDLS